ncbi:MAG: GNAT family N-acetyltransferase [Gaiellaceae bacterium]
MSDFERVVGFRRDLEERCSDRIVPSFLATALFNTALPLVWDRNYLRIEDRNARAAELVALADRLQGGAGLQHRRIVSDDPESGQRLAAEFHRLAWEVERRVVMAYTQSAVEDVVPLLVSEWQPAALLGFWEESERLWHPDRPDVVRQLVDARLVEARKIDARFLACQVDGRIASGCRLYLRGATAQIEDVFTHPEFRNRGLASAVVRAAAERARSAGHDLVWLMASADDWPKALYAKLGFTPIGEFMLFTRVTA